ncbi:hypothetical protein RHABOEDO_001522 [Candidatus Rhabdochlamydia oedothoracis]|uniref:Uncharacterized protein n=1 Tax=Candidatus Rhabdochlamydia oedothoracis TaxID=2720720 RepID=A0ABX8V7P4_9BACT|nr:hypothetical protein RHOW815_001273 [Candidatus Rhabdochlamydia sp. W815]QYF49224.1 hypothetical protein RHABOEDO_001522 [Candidatus Rhabdochlamydia oedothoracis]
MNTFISNFFLSLSLACASLLSANEVRDHWKGNEYAKNSESQKAIEYPKWELCDYYFPLWNKKDDKNSKRILEIVLKKIGWRGQKKQWSERENKLCNY